MEGWQDFKLKGRREGENPREEWLVGGWKPSKYFREKLWRASTLGLETLRGGFASALSMSYTMPSRFKPNIYQ